MHRIRHFGLTVALMLASGCAEREVGVTADVSGLDVFWDVTEILQRDEEPSDSLWDAMWNTPGYALFERFERRRSTLTRAMRLAYKPSLRAEADSVLTQPGWVSFVLPHLREIPRLRDSLQIFRETFINSELMSEARTAAREYLPAGVTDRYPMPDVSFMYFIDARGYGERILMDPLHFMNIRNPLEVLAHEFHHYYRIRIEKPTRPFGSDMLAWRLSTVESEGIAGMLDKADVPGMSMEELFAKYPAGRRRDYFVEYQVEYRRSDERLSQVDDVFRRAGAHPDSAEALGRWIDGQLPDNGRILGAFMAATIEQQLGREQLADVVGNPFEFWRVYNDAAGRTDAPTLSEEALRAIAGIEAMYAEEGGR